MAVSVQYLHVLTVHPHGVQPVLLEPDSGTSPQCLAMLLHVVQPAGRTGAARWLAPAQPRAHRWCSVGQGYARPTRIQRVRILPLGSCHVPLDVHLSPSPRLLPDTPCKEGELRSFSPDLALHGTYAQDTRGHSARSASTCVLGAGLDQRLALHHAVTV